MSSFCPELQLPWSLRSLEAKNLSQLTIRAEVAAAMPRPETTDRHVRDIMSQPSVALTLIEADFVFRNCFSVAVQDELLVSMSEETEKGDGMTFVRFLESRRLDAARRGRPDYFPVYHYRLIFQDEIIDIVCGEVPNIALRHMREPEKPVAGV